MTDAANTERKSMSFTELGLRFGHEMLIMPDPTSKDNIFPSDLIGCLSNESILIGPQSGVEQFPNLVEGQRIVVQIKLAGGVAFFPTTVLFVSEIPTVMIYLDYPRDVKFKQVRGALRVEVALPVLVFNKAFGDSQSAVVGKIVDISTSGAGLEMFESVGHVGDTIQIKGKFQVGEIQRVLSVEAVIRSKANKQGRFFYGIKFHEGNEDKLLVLMGFTFHAMAFGHLQTIR